MQKRTKKRNLQRFSSDGTFMNRDSAPQERHTHDIQMAFRILQFLLHHTWRRLDFCPKTDKGKGILLLRQTARQKNEQRRKIPSRQHDMRPSELPVRHIAESKEPSERQGGVCQSNRQGALFQTIYHRPVKGCRPRTGLHPERLLPGGNHTHTPEQDSIPTGRQNRNTGTSSGIPGCRDIPHTRMDAG